MIYLLTSDVLGYPNHSPFYRIEVVLLSEGAWWLLSFVGSSIVVYIVCTFANTIPSTHTIDHAPRAIELVDQG